MKAYSHDLRERVAAYAEPGAKIDQVAARFSVSLSFTDKLLRRQRTSSSVAELPRHPGPVPRSDAAGDQRLLACLRAQPDATLAEIGQASWWRPAARRCSARPCGRRWNASAGDAKKSVHAAECDTERVVAVRRLFVEAMQEKNGVRFVFVDETSTNLTSGRGTAVLLHGAPNVTLIAAFTPDGFWALMRVDGAVNGDVFAAYLDQVLGSTLRPGDVVVLDNLSGHKVDGLAGIV